jgi:Ca-activated chloride channel family protein
MTVCTHRLPSLMRRGLIAMSGLLLLLPAPARADAGTLIPRGKTAPDAAILSLEEMSVEVTIDNGDAHIAITQIFRNRTANIEEGTYRFSLPTGSTVSDFAVWDGVTRIPAVILERKRAEQIYDQARLQAIDPGLLEQGERDHLNPLNTATFTARIVPIPAYGTKRLELDYHQRLTVADFQQFFALPLKPDAGQKQSAHHFKLHLKLQSAHTIDSFQTPSRLYPLKLAATSPTTVEGTFEATDLAFDEDFSAAWRLVPPAQDMLNAITYRNPSAPLPQAGTSHTANLIKSAAEPGFFEADLLLASPVVPHGPTEHAAGNGGEPRTLILLFDTSLSMQWEKLERSYAALEATLHSLRPEDRFNLILFNQDVSPFKPQATPAAPSAIQQALEFVRASKLRGGTDLGKAVTVGLAQATDPNTSLLLFTDGGSNRGETVIANKIATVYSARWKQTISQPHTCVFAVGDDANLTLLRRIAANGGFMESVLSTEPVDFHLKSFLSKLTSTPVANLALTVEPATAARLIYPLDDTVYPGSLAQWVGEYTPGKNPLNLTAHDARTALPLPETDLSHPQLPRLWAQARVHALLDQIDREGETTAAIDEIIRLSRRYKFVTPYTSFLAVPRSLLRPRVIRPGDPVLRVRTDAQIDSVIAIFPFGLTKPLRHLASEDLQAPGDTANRLWETRFLAPPEMKDGTYSVRLLLRDTHGNTYNEAKTFVIASTPPTVKLQLARSSLHRGETLELRASASTSTRTLTAHLEGIEPISLRWNPRAATNTGTLTIPSDLPIGRYTLTVTAEDIAHNLGSQEVQLDVIP